MSLQDVYITEDDASPLKIGIEGQLHHPFSRLRLAADHNRNTMAILDYPTPWAFGSRMNVQLDALPMTVHDMYCELTLSAAASPNANGRKWVNGACFIDAQGAGLAYKEVELYHEGPAQPLLDLISNTETDKLFNMQNVLGMTEKLVSAAQKIYIPLTPMAENVLSKIGPLAAYPSNSFSVNISIRPQVHLITSLDSDATTAAGAVSITGMKLYLMGTKSSEQEISLCREALTNSGIVWNFLRPNEFTSADLTNAKTTPTQLRYDSVVGAIAYAKLIVRPTANLNGTIPYASNAAGVDPLNVNVNFYTAGNWLSVGKLSNPTEVGGQRIPMPLLTTLFGAPNSYLGCSRFLIEDLGAGTSLPRAIDMQLINLAFSHSSLSSSFGLSTGSYPVKNDFMITFDTIAASVPEAQTIQTIVYSHVKGFINIGAANINLSS